MFRDFQVRSGPTLFYYIIIFFKYLKCIFYKFVAIVGPTGTRNMEL